MNNAPSVPRLILMRFLPEQVRDALCASNFTSIGEVIAELWRKQVEGKNTQEQKDQKEERPPLVLLL